MTDNQTRKLTRMELLQLLLEEEEENDKLRERITQLESELESLSVGSRDLGSLSESLDYIHTVFAAADDEVTDYLRSLLASTPPEAPPEPPVTPDSHEAEPEPVPEIEPEPVAEPEPVPEIKPEPVAEPEPVPEIKPEPVAEPELPPNVQPVRAVESELPPTIQPEASERAESEQPETYAESGEQYSPEESFDYAAEHDEERSEPLDWLLYPFSDLLEPYESDDEDRVWTLKKETEKAKRIGKKWWMNLRMSLYSTGGRRQKST